MANISGEEAVKSNLLRIQSAFMSLLGDNNDLIQDAASKVINGTYLFNGLSGYFKVI